MSVTQSDHLHDANDAGRTQAAADAPRFDEKTTRRVKDVFARMERTVTLQLQLDATERSTRLRAFVDALVRMSDGALDAIEETVTDLDPEGRGRFDIAQPLPYATPMVRFLIRDGEGRLQPTGIAFHGVPAGHEFEAFVLGLYDVAGPGQPMPDDVRARVEEIHDPVEIMLLVSFDCTICPGTVRAAQRIAAFNPNVRAEAYDVARFPEIARRYDAEYVPCVVLRRRGRSSVEFGAADVSRMLDLIDRM